MSCVRKAVVFSRVFGSLGTAANYSACSHVLSHAPPPDFWVCKWCENPWSYRTETSGNRLLLCLSHHNSWFLTLHSISLLRMPCSFSIKPLFSFFNPPVLDPLWSCCSLNLDPKSLYWWKQRHPLSLNIWNNYITV